MNKVYLGLDVHCKQTMYAMLDDEGKVLKEGSVATTTESLLGLVDELGLEEGTKIGMETGTQHFFVSNTLKSLGMDTLVIDAAEVRKKARRIGQKTDRRDAFEICDGIRRDLYTSIVWVPTPQIDTLRRILSRRRHFVRVRTQQINAAKFLLRQAGINPGRLLLVSWSAWERLLSRNELASLREHLDMHAQIWKQARDHIDRLEEQLEKALYPFAGIANLFMSVPGIGLITAATYIAVIGTPERFADSSRVVSYIGLAPSTYDSGDKERHGRITKRGSSHLRSVLVEAAHHASKPTHPLNPYFARLIARQGYKRAVVAVAHRLARILYRIWKDNKPFDVRKLNVVREKRTLKKVVNYRIKTEKERSLARV